jgi:signal transduction histidine kinase
MKILIIEDELEAVRHNITGGIIEISATQHQLIIANTGNDQDVNPDVIFRRFAEASGLPDSLGLGLAIIKKICN